MAHRLLKFWKIGRNFRIGANFPEILVRNTGYMPAVVMHNQYVLVPNVLGFRTGIITLRNISSNSGSSDSSDSDSDSDIDEELEKDFKSDPELKKIVQEFTTHFKQDRTGIDEISEVSDKINSTIEDSTDEIEEYVEKDSLETIDDKKQAYYRQQEEIIEAEIQRQYTEEDEDFIFETVEKTPPVSLARGETGVFDIDELVVLLKADNAMDLCVIKTPPLLNYVDHMVIVTGKSYRHLKGMAETIKHLYKKKRVKGDSASVQIEGLESKNWLAMDLGNIAVHLFLEETREVYDLETLWSVGSQFDDLSQQVYDDPLAALLSDEYLKQLEIISDTETIDASNIQR